MSKTTGVLLGYRYRFYPETNTYLGTKEGRIWLYQPSVSGAINDIASMVDYLPLAIRDTDALKTSAARPPRASACVRSAACRPLLASRPG